MVSRERRTSGAFYTPQELVSRVAGRALAIALASPECEQGLVSRALEGRAIDSSAATALRKRLRQFLVLDPACGSGAFLVHVLERLADLHVLTGDTRPICVIRREVVSRSIHGVDVNPTAVWLCELRLWLSVVIEHEETRMGDVPPLPNLDCNIRIGDSLLGEAFSEPALLIGRSQALARIRRRYIRATGPAKAPLRRALAQEEMGRAIAELDRQLIKIDHRRRERVRLRKERNLFGEQSAPDAGTRKEMRADRLLSARLRREKTRIRAGGALSFSFPSHFGTAHATGGFHLVVGNPPWVRLHNIPATSRATLRQSFTVFRRAQWEFGSANANASRGFASQTDLSALFAERSSQLVSPDGCVALLLPAKLWRSLAGGAVRALLNGQMLLREVDDWTDAPATFDAAVYPSIAIATPRDGAAPQCCTAGVRRSTSHFHWTQRPELLRLIPGDDASPWLVIPRDVRDAFDRLRARGTQLGMSELGRPTLGVKCGCNDAFILEMIEHRGAFSSVQQRGRRAEVESAMMRPLIRGEGLTPWRVTPSSQSLLWTHDAQGRPMQVLPPGAAKWLGPWKRQLAARTDLHGATKWWSLFRTEGAEPSKPRVVWGDFGRQPRAAFVPPGDPSVPLNTCYVVSCNSEIDALALTALLNSPLVAAWLNVIAEPARGGWHRYLAWTVSLLPVPLDWAHARTALATMAERAFDGVVPTAEELIMAACKAYHLRKLDVAPLLAWMHT